MENQVDNKIILNDEDAIGVIYFIPDGEFKKGKPCLGTIKERYREGSVYIGQGEYDGKNFYRQGFGEQEFSNSTLRPNMHGPENTYAYKFRGYYDRHTAAWMHGNGVMYFVDENNKPCAFVKGFFNNQSDVTEWHGEFNNDWLIPGYTPDMETYFVPFVARFRQNYENYKDVTNCDYLFFGDSWVENWCFSDRMYGGSTWYEDVKARNMNAVNVGVGGTKYSDWEDKLDDIIVSHHPKKIFINLGFNDLHGGQTVEEVFSHFKFIVETLHAKLPETKIFIAGTTHCPAFVPFRKKELALNKLEEEYAKKTDYITYLPVDKLFMKGKKMIKKMPSYCVDDMLHLNRSGYDIWGNAILDALTK